MAADETANLEINLLDGSLRSIAIGNQQWGVWRARRDVIAHTNFHTSIFTLLFFHPAATDRRRQSRSPRRDRGEASPSAAGTRIAEPRKYRSQQPKPSSPQAIKRINRF